MAQQIKLSSAAAVDELPQFTLPPPPMAPLGGSSLGDTLEGGGDHREPGPNGTRPIPTESPVQQERRLLSGGRSGADSQRNSVPRPDTRGMSGVYLDSADLMSTEVLQEIIPVS